MLIKVPEGLNFNQSSDVVKLKSLRHLYYGGFSAKLDRIGGVDRVKGSDPNGTYTINGKRMQLGESGADGKVSLLASVRGDLNDDGRDDRAVILILNSVGSGVFYYLNA